jgi:hypothetical protein
MGEPSKRIIAKGNWSKGNITHTSSSTPNNGKPITTPNLSINSENIVPSSEEGHITGESDSPLHPPSILNKVKSIVNSYASRGITQDKRCDSNTKRIRSISCHGDESLGIAPCSFRRISKEEGRYYCGECGCGDRPATWLNSKTPEDYTKLDFPTVVCPLNMPGFTNYTPAIKETVARKMKYDFTRKEQIERSVDLTIKQTDEKNK